MAIVVTTFELTPGTTTEAFAAADSRYQQDVAYQQPGMLRRTTAKADDGRWCVVGIWSSGADAVAWHTSDLAPLVTNVERSVYETLD